MRIELFGIARARAGTATLDVEAATLGDALAALAARGLDLEHFRFSLNGAEFVSDPGLALAPADTLVVMGAQVGG